MQNFCSQKDSTAIDEKEGVNGDSASKNGAGSSSGMGRSAPTRGAKRHRGKKTGADQFVRMPMFDEIQKLVAS